MPVDFPQQKQALLAFHQATGGPHWTVHQNYTWQPDSSMCTAWAGVACDPWGRVVKVHLTDKNLRGTLPSDLAALSSLSFFDLGTNQISGTIPSFAFARNLTYLWLNQNMFSGTIPVDLPQPNIVQLELSQNMLSGAIPDEFAKLSRLEYLDLSSNKLSKLPDIGATLLKLNSNGTDRKCNLSQNHFGCPVPESLEYPSACGAVCGVYIDSV